MRTVGKDHAQTHKHQTHAHDAGSKTGLEKSPVLTTHATRRNGDLPVVRFSSGARELNRTHEGIFTHDALRFSCEEHQAGRFPHDPSPNAH